MRLVPGAKATRNTVGSPSQDGFPCVGEYNSSAGVIPQSTPTVLIGESSAFPQEKKKNAPSMVSFKRPSASCVANVYKMDLLTDQTWQHVDSCIAILTRNLPML